MQGSFLLTRIVTGTEPGCEDSHPFPSSDVSGMNGVQVTSKGRSRAMQFLEISIRGSWGWREFLRQSF